MQHVTGLKCTLCGNVYKPDEVEYVCPEDDGNLDVLYDYDAINAYVKQNGLKNVQGIWRYKALMPINHDAAEPPLLVGNTPLYDSEKLVEVLGLKRVWVKDDGRNPTASLKDRASALIVAKAGDEGRDIVTTASTGNAAAALAGLAASVQMPTVIFVPASAPPAKITQLLVYGAEVLLVNGTYGDAFNLCLEATHKYGWYCRNTGYNPYTAEGKKTVAYEICEQLAGVPGEFRAPDAVFVSVGDGNIISGLHKGLKDLLALGWIDQMPRIYGVQADGSAALYNAWKKNVDPVDMQPIDANTVADSISAGLPSDRIKAMNAVKETQGAYISVSDEEILAAIPTLARATGVFAEPAASATYAGVQKAVDEQIVGANDEIVILLTGNGLKDVASAQRTVPEAPRVDPDIAAVARIIDG